MCSGCTRGSFHDGTDLDAAAVAWNFERIMDPEEKALTRPYLEVIEAVESLDAHTVKFTLKYPTQTFLPALAVYPRPFLIKAPSTYKTWGRKDAHLHPIGTGPFKLARWEQNQIIVPEKNPDYFKKGLPYLDRIELKIMKDGITRATALRAGEVDFQLCAQGDGRTHLQRPEAPAPEGTGYPEREHLLQ